MARRSSQQKLIGWGAFAAMLLVIVAIFFVTRLLGGSPRAPATPTASVAEAPSSAAAASAASSSAPSASANVAAAPSVAPASAAPPASRPSAEAASSTPDVEVVDAGTMSQQSRRELLLTLIKQGVFTGIEALGTPPKVGVTALFTGLSPSLQQQFIAVVYSYINNGAAGTKPLQLIDAASGAEVGSYSATDGLKLS